MRPAFDVDDHHRAVQRVYEEYARDYRAWVDDTSTSSPSPTDHQHARGRLPASRAASPVLWIKRRIWRKDPAYSQLVVDTRVPVRRQSVPQP
ncbi:hypothetical protein [Streptomyces sp. NRRL F-5650]|uniref:hypothetical protein n=1 Tax=Streptomyces sp. NRRL F-5650 TaxID=1463868 RepID=UPI0004C8294B|nr:hypothetical protein [Streptomyces sp. NRRL F-5650]